MSIPGIKKLFLFFITIVFALSVKAQQPHFIYLQTDNGTPFYTRFNGKIISSSSEGYIILSGVINGDYQLIVGFPKNEFPEETFKISVNDNNEGFLLKNFDEKGLQLFNFQTLALIEGARNNTATNVKKDDDRFSTMLAGVVKDPSILQDHENIRVTSVKKADTLAAVNTDTSKALTNLSSEGWTIFPPLSALVSKDSSAITKILDTQDKEGVQMAYADRDSGATDTINVLIPVEKSQPDSNEDMASIAQNNPLVGVDSSANASANTANEKNADDLKKQEIIGPGSQNGDLLKVKDSLLRNTGVEKSSETGNITSESHTDTLLEKPSENKVILLPKEVSSSRTNSDCKDFATDNDFLKLRSKMAEESDDNKMIRVATKYFKSKCYSTAQIKNLSYIFLTNEGKYQFFEAAYPFISDSGQYPLLATQFTDTYYRNRFEALVSK